MNSASNLPPHPFQVLTPDLVLDALASVGLYGDGRLLALSSYENRVYQIHLEDGSVVVAKFYRPERWSDEQIQEEHDFAAELMAAEIPMIGSLLLQGRSLQRFGGFSFSVSPRRGGRMPELDDAEVLEWVGRFLARIHTVGSQAKFGHRPKIDLQSFGVASRDWLLANDRLPLDVQASWAQACQEALTLIAGHDCLNADAAVQSDSAIRSIRLHGDCHPGNILWTPTEVPAVAGPGPHVVDLDDTRSGPAVQDLWMLVSGSRAQQTRQLGILLDGYEQFREFDRRELALIEPLRTLRLIHYGAWLARRWSDPIFPINFPWFGSSDYWKGQIQMLQDQIEAMQEPPLRV